MKKNIIIILLAIVSIFSLTYGYLQKERADEQEGIAIENDKIAREAEIKVKEIQKNAAEQMAIAIMNEQRAREAIKAAEELKK